MSKNLNPKELTPPQKLQRVVKLVDELQAEESEAIVESRLAGIAKELGVNPFACAMVYHIKNMSPDFQKAFGADVRIRVRPK